jgi:hypothetical protein
MAVNFIQVSGIVIILINGASSTGKVDPSKWTLALTGIPTRTSESSGEN